MVTNILADRIERFILNQLSKQSTPVIILKRKDVAELLNCAPSQVTYVINTRFGSNQRFHVESRRGSGGLIRISVKNAPSSAGGEPKNGQAPPGGADPEYLLKQYFHMLVSSGTITMREFLMMRELIDMFMEHCPEEHRANAAKDAATRINRIIKEGI